MGTQPVPDIHIAERGRDGTFSLGRDTLRLRLAEKDFATHDNLKCEDKNLTKRYPERFFANQGEFKLELQLAAEGIEDRVKINGQEIEVSARVWVHGQEKGSAFCYILGTDGNWYIKTSEKPPREEKGVNYWELGEARAAKKSDIDALKNHINSVKERE